jgi:pilus assembly protein CpaE
VANGSEIVLLICAERDKAAELAHIVQAKGYRVVAAPFGPAALSRATEAALIVVDRVEGASNASASAVSRIKDQPHLAAVPLLAIAQTDSADERIALLEAGADDVMNHPVDNAEFEARLDVLIAHQTAVPSAEGEGAPAAPARPAPRLFTFFSSKGGVGTTTLAVDVAVALALKGSASVALVDMDLASGQVATHLDLNARVTVVELARDDATLSDADLLRAAADWHKSGLSVYSAPHRPDQGPLMSVDLVRVLLDALLSAFDIVIADAGSVLDERTLALFERSERVVLVLAPELPTVRATHALMEVLAEYEGPSERQLFVLNHVYADDTLRPDDVERSLQAQIHTHIPYEPTLYLKAVNVGVPLVMSAPKSAPAEAIERLATQLAGALPKVAAPAAEQQKRKSLVGLLRRG